MPAISAWSALPRLHGEEEKRNNGPLKGRALNFIYPAQKTSQSD